MKNYDLGSIRVSFIIGESEAFKASYAEIGVLKVSTANSNKPGSITYSTFGKYGIVFPLEDELGQIVNMYAYRFKLEKPFGEYLYGDGVYPRYPKRKTSRLILTDNVIDCASLLQAEVMENQDSAIALRDGELTDDIRSLIAPLHELNEILVISKTENKKLIKELRKIHSARVLSLELPKDHSLNDMWLLYGSEGIEKFLDDTEQGDDFIEVSDREFFYQGDQVAYHIHGVLPKNPTLLELQFEIDGGQDVYRGKIDLLNTDELKEKLFLWTEGKALNYATILIEMEFITTTLERIRKSNKSSVSKGFDTTFDKQAKHLLKSDNLFEELNALIGNAGIIGEEKRRLLLFIVASSYKFNYNLHAVIHSDNIEQGSELVENIAGLIPENERYEIDLTTSRTFRYYGNSIINNRLIVIPDYSGVTSSKAINDLKRLQAKGTIVNDVPVKGPDGLLSTVKQTVKGHTSSIGACINSKRYFENEPRTILVGMDDSLEQVQRHMDYDSMQMSGQINQKQEQKAKELLQHVVRNIFPLEVVNPHSSALMLPLTVRNARILTMQLNGFVSLVTLFNQHKRKKDNLGRVITEKEDIQIGIDLFLDAIMVNIDELDTSTRTFFDKLKVFVKNGNQNENTALSAIDIRYAMQMSKSTVNRFLRTLVDFEYVKKEGFKNTGFTYIVTNWKELNVIKETIQNRLGGSGAPKALGH